MRRLHSLDGLRTLSIALVLLGHGLGERAKEQLGDLGNFGVRWFFVISGFLITRLLLLEIATAGEVSLRRFYVRRALRIFPAFYAFLLVLFLVQQGGLIEPISPQSWAHALTYTINYQVVTSRSWYVAHLWSLAVEEQFYLLWPFVLMIFGVRRGMLAVAAVVVAAPVLRWIVGIRFPAHLIDVPWHFETVCDSLATGCLLAGGRDWLWARRAYRDWLGSPFVAVALLTVFAMNWFVVRHLRVGLFAGQTIMNVGIALCVDRCLRFHTGPVGRLLNWRPVAYVGTLSYSIYLWQQIFFNGSVDSPITRFPVNLALTVAVAWGSYTLIERPFLRLKDRFASSMAVNVPGRSTVSVESRPI